MKTENKKLKKLVENKSIDLHVNHNTSHGSSDSHGTSDSDSMSDSMGGTSDTSDHSSDHESDTNENDDTNDIDNDIDDIDNDENQDNQDNQERNQKTVETKREEKEKQKQQKLERKSMKPNYNLILELKLIWEDLRRKKLIKNERKELVNRMMKIVKGKVIDIIYKHDASRIIQSCIKYGTLEDRDVIANELAGYYANLSQSKYGRFIVSKILQYCSQKYRNLVITDFYGKVRKLIRHKEASLILDEAYSQYANATQRAHLMEEFYGPEFAIFKNDDGTKGSLQELIKTHPLKKSYVLKHTRAAIDAVLEKASFNVGRTPILHRAILDYLVVAEPSACKDLIELLKDHLVHMLHTREGARVAQYCILHATPKDRKQIVKSFKSFVHSIAKEQYGHAVLLSCFECIDDTVLVGKALISELLTSATDSPINELLRNQYGSRVILFLLSGRNKRYQPSYLIKELEESDLVRAETTKKDSELRRKQLLEVVSPLMIPLVAQYTDELIRDRNGSLILLETCNHADGDMSPIIESVVKCVKLSASGSILTGRENLDEEEVVHVVKKMKADRDIQKKKEQGVDMTESILVGRSSLLVLKLLLAKSKDEKETCPAWKTSFQTQIWSILESKLEEIIKESVSNPFTSSGISFVLVALFEASGKEIQESMKKAVSHSIDKMQKTLDEQLKQIEPTATAGSKKRKQNTQVGISILLNHLKSK